MKRFEDILKYTQNELKAYLCNYLCGVGYKIDNGNGYIFAKGTIPVMLIAHMDTAKKEIPKKIINENGKIYAKDSIVGGDDRCGVWMIMNIIKQAKCHVLFVEDEEIGCVGAKKFIKTKHADYIKENISFMIELDRRGNNDCVYYSNDNKDFIKYIVEKTKTKEASGTMSDISSIMPETKIAGVNLSCGYYNEHTKKEYIVVDEMNDMMNRLITFLTTENEFPKFEYVAKAYQMTLADYYTYSYKNRKPMTLAQKAMRTMDEMILTVVLNPEYFDFDPDFDNEIEAAGRTPAECWATLFLENEDLCFNMISDYYFI